MKSGNPIPLQRVSFKTLSSPLLTNYNDDRQNVHEGEEGEPEDEHVDKVGNSQREHNGRDGHECYEDGRRV